jgi:hypothetical protein
LNGVYAIHRQAPSGAFPSSKALQVLQRQGRQFQWWAAAQKRLRETLQAVGGQNPDVSGHVKLHPKVWARPSLRRGPLQQR